MNNQPGLVGGPAPPLKVTPVAGARYGLSRSTVRDPRRALDTPYRGV